MLNTQLAQIDTNKKIYEKWEMKPSFDDADWLLIMPKITAIGHLLFKLS